MQIPDLWLGVAAEWVEAHCVIPDQEHRGEPFLLGDEQLVFLANHYAVRTDAVAGQKAEAFVYRRSQLVRAQKWGKSPLVAAFVCLEGVGPALFDGFAEAGDVYDCRDFGCGCGWAYAYEPGEPMGRPWPTALIQITATSEDQTDNTYDALRPMIELGPLAELIPKTGEEFIRLPNGGRIEAVTSKATSRLGQRITFAAQDETGLWLASNGGHKLARTQRRGLAGMGGRSIETTNAWNPGEDSVAQQTYETDVADINKDFRQPPRDLDFTQKRDRRKIFAFNYAGAPWVPLASIESEAAELLMTDPADAERFFGNRLVSGAGQWFDMAKWEAKDAPIEVAPRTRIVLGFDGSDNDDHTGIRAETLDLYQFTPTYGPNRLPTRWNPRECDGRIPRAEVMAAFREIATEYEVVRAYLDPFMWESEIDELAAEFGERVFIKWHTNRINQMCAALERFKVDVYSPDSRFTHDSDEQVSAHIANAAVRPRRLDPATGRRIYIIGKPNEHQKIDYAMSSTLAHEAAMDAIAAGESAAEPEHYIYY